MKNKVSQCKSVQKRPRDIQDKDIASDFVVSLILSSKDITTDVWDKPLLG